MAVSFRPMVRTDPGPTFYGNALRFATREEAQRSADDLERRWFLVLETRVEESDDPVNYHLDLATGEVVSVRDMPRVDPKIVASDERALRDQIQRQGL